MSRDQILDEHLTRRARQEKICKRLRTYTLLFTGLMGIGYLLFRIQHWRYSSYFLLIGLVAITLQSILCFVTMREKTWMAGIRALVTLLATLYLILLFSGWLA